MMTDPSNTCLYIGVTSNLFKRVNEHRTHAVDGYTKTHDCIKLVYYEEFLDTYMAIQREKTLKGKLRRKKNAIIEEMNPDWKDLFPTLYEDCISPDSSLCSPRRSSINGAKTGGIPQGLV
jgi:putative endonuclease